MKLSQFGSAAVLLTVQSCVFAHGTPVPPMPSAQPWRSLAKRGFPQSHEGEACHD
jgi:hypothetical protein